MNDALERIAREVSLASPSNEGLRVEFVLEARKRNAMRFDGTYYDSLQMSLLHEAGA